MRFLGKSRSLSAISDLRIDVQLQPKQSELLHLVDEGKASNIGYGGPRGGGKSRGIRDIMLLRRFKHPKTTGWIVRRTFGDVWENHIDKYFQERPYTRDWYNTQQKMMLLPNGSQIKFKYAEHEGDLERDEYGKEAMDIFVDQAEQFSERETEFMRTCRRWTGIADGLCKMVSCINPGGKSHGYMKRVFIDRLYKDNEVPDEYVFLTAAGWDNVEWVRPALAADGFTEDDFYTWDEERRFTYFITRSQYGRDLNAKPETMRIQQLLGRWDFFEGQVFPELSEKHNLDNYFDTANEELWSQFHSGLKKIGGLDHATTGTTDYGLSGVDVDENLFELDEYYQADRLISEHAASIKLLKSHYGEVDYQVIDPSTEAKTLQNRDDLYSVQDAYRREGLLFLSAHRASIGVGLDLIKEYLKLDPLHRNPFTQQKPSPRLFISRRRCPNLWSEMSELQTKDGKFIGKDHAVDVLRYKLMSRPRADARRERDVAQLPGMEQKAIRTHDRWAKDFDKKIDKSTGNYW